MSNELSWEQQEQVLGRHDFERNTPAATPFDGMALGNADMGAIIFGPAYKLTFRLTKLDLWDSRFNAESYVPPLPLSQLKERIFELSRNVGTDETIRFPSTGQNQCWHEGEAIHPCMRIAADLCVRVCNAVPLPARCQQRLRLADGLHEAHFPMGWWDKDSRDIVCQSFISWYRNVLALRVTIPDGYRDRVVLSLWRDPYGGRTWELLSAGPSLQGEGEGFYRRDPRVGMLPASETQIEGSDASLWQTIPGDEHCPERGFAVYAAADGGAFFREPSGHAALELLDRKEATLFVALTSEMEGPDSRERAEALAKEAASEGWDALHDQHAAGWREFWTRSAVELEDRGLERVWARDTYELGITARSGRPAPGLYGVRIPIDCPAWRGDRHNNWPEYSMRFWSAFSGNRPEQALNYTEFVCGYLPTARRIAREVFECEQGAVFPLCYVDGTSMYWFHHTWAWSLFLSALHAQNCWWHYQHFGGEEFLRESAYPVMRECALFYVELIRKNEPGDYTLWPTIATEIRGWTKDFRLNRNCIEDLAHVKFLIRAVLEASTILDCDEEWRPVWQDLLDHLPEYPTLTLDGKTEFADFADQKSRPAYNHAVPLGVCWPAEDPDVFRDPRLREIVANTLDAYPWQEPTRVNITLMRLGEKQRVWDALLGQELQPDDLAPRLKGTGLLVQEMLMTSWDGVIHVFPCWPPEKPARFVNLRAKGAFLVSASSEGGTIREATIHSECGNPAAVRSPWPSTDILCTTTGETVEPQIDGPILRFETDPGSHYRLTPSS